jgi:uncharacterized membrane protein YeiH
VIAALGQAETITGLDESFERLLDLAGVFVFAISGALLGVRKGYDVVGVVALGVVTALGGGVIRDVMLGATPVTAVREPWYLVVPLAGTMVVFVGHTWIARHLSRPVIIFDAAGLGLFCVTGAVTSVRFDVTPAGAILLGVVSAVGGGLLRDVFANDEPMIFRRATTLYTIPAAIGATVVVVAWRNDVYTGTLGLVTAAGVFAVRLLAMRFDWHAPRPFSPRPTSADPDDR